MTVNSVPPSRFSPNSILFIEWRGLVILFIFPALTPWGMSHTSISKSLPIRQGFSMRGQALIETFSFLPSIPLKSKFLPPLLFCFLNFHKEMNSCHYCQSLKQIKILWKGLGCWDLQKINLLREKKKKGTCSNFFVDFLRDVQPSNLSHQTPFKLCEGKQLYC